MLYLQLFWEFFKTGLFSVGGGLATLPFLYDMAKKHPDWIDASSIMDMLAVSESTPGPIGVNMSTYTGFKTGGVLGSLMATMGLVIPSVIIVLIIAGILTRFKESKYVQAAFYGMRPATMGLIAAATIVVIKEALMDTSALAKGDLLGLFEPVSVIYCIILIMLMSKLKVHPIVFVAVSAVIGCFVKF